MTIEEVRELARKAFIVCGIELPDDWSMANDLLLDGLTHNDLHRRQLLYEIKKCFPPGVLLGTARKWVPPERTVGMLVIILHEATKESRSTNPIALGEDLVEPNEKYL